METQKDETLKTLEPLFKEAREKNLLFYCYYQNLWFTPDELQKENEKGKFIWGSINWELKTPTDKLRFMADIIYQHEKILYNLRLDYKHFQKKYGLECNK